ncbi:type II toxin-antitoxin system HicB family antitoxin [Streptomyces sp. NPDC001678]|uniref:type II toxin-antitoxin system HicB family antitoxin n=1 Tax=Streptomyces sp. NPDC001678 TaxID=3364599 RepID=UPI0036BF052B
MTEHALLHLTAAVTKEDEWYVARCLRVEVTSQGATFEESLNNLREALELYFEDAPAPEAYEAQVITVPSRSASREPGASSRAVRAEVGKALMRGGFEYVSNRGSQPSTGRTA